jgi:SAM-dependent methyltransferase
MSGEETYLLGMSPDEIRRLAHQHEAWRSETARLWALAGVGPGQTVVDLGCGPGFTTVDLAGLVGRAGRVVAIDSSTAAAHELRGTLARDRIGNVEVVEALEADVNLAAHGPDVVFARWLYWFLPEAGHSVARVAGALRPGARFVVMDYCNYRGIATEPRSALFDHVFRAVYQSVADGGGSLDIAGHMPRLFRASGLRVTALIALQQVARPGEPVWEWVSSFQRLHLPALVERGYLTAAELASHLAWWSELERNPDAVFFAPPVMGVVGVKD